MEKIDTKNITKDSETNSFGAAGPLGGFALLLLFLFAGEVLNRLGLPMPGNVLGMLLLTAALGLGVVRRRQIEKAARFLLDHMALFFIPAGVGLMAHGQILSSHWPILLFSVLVSTFVVLLSSGIISRQLIRKGSGNRKGADHGN